MRETREERVLQHNTRALSGHARHLDDTTPSRPLTRRESLALAVPVAGRRAHRGGLTLRGLIRKLLPVGALTLSGALVVTMTVPASALVPAFEPAAAPTTATVPALTAEAQSVEVADVEAADAERGEYKIVQKPKPKPKPKPAPARYSVASAPAAPPAAVTAGVRWPVADRSVSDGFGWRASPCAGCSSQHMGTDFTAGNGAPVSAIAAGTVAIVGSSGGYGTHVYIDHVINGQTVRSLYAHLQAGSAAVVVGQQVSAGTYLGAVGMTGSATGPHLHHEILVNGVNVDPYAWLQANAG